MSLGGVIFWFLVITMVVGIFYQEKDKRIEASDIRVHSVMDGKTFTATVRDWPPALGEKIQIVISGIQIPDAKSKNKEERKAARLCKKTTKARLDTATRIELVNVVRNENGQIQSEVHVDGRPLADTLIRKGLAHRI